MNWCNFRQIPNANALIRSALAAALVQDRLRARQSQPEKRA